MTRKLRTHEKQAKKHVIKEFKNVEFSRDNLEMGEFKVRVQQRKLCVKASVKRMAVTSMSLSLLERHLEHKTGHKVTVWLHAKGMLEAEVHTDTQGGGA